MKYKSTEFSCTRRSGSSGGRARAVLPLLIDILLRVPWSWQWKCPLTSSLELEGKLEAVLEPHRRGELANVLHHKYLCGSANKFILVLQHTKIRGGRMTQGQVLTRSDDALSLILL